MSKDHTDKLVKHGPDIVKNLRVEDILLALEQSSCITHYEYQEIKSEATQLKQSECFLAILRTKSEGAYWSFDKVLRKNDRKHIADLLEPTYQAASNSLGNFF